MGEILWQAPNIQKCSVCGNKICKGFAFVIVWRTEKNEEYIIDVIHRKCASKYFDWDGEIPSRHGITQIKYLCKVKGVVYELEDF